MAQDVSTITARELESIAGIQLSAGENAWFETQQRQTGAEFTRVTDPLIGECVIWWPAGKPDGNVFGLVSSRPPVAWDQLPAWFQMLRRVYSRFARDDNQAWSLAVEGTIAAEFVQHAAKLYQRRCVVLYVDESATSLKEWLQELIIASDTVQVQQSAPRAQIVPDASRKLGFVSPPSDVSQNGPRSFHDVPRRDRVLVAWPMQLWALHLRRGGNVDRLIRARLAERSPANVFVALHPKLQSRRLANELLQTGAVGWITRGSVPAALAIDREPEVQERYSRANVTAEPEVGRQDLSASAENLSTTHTGAWRSAIIGWEQLPNCETLQHCTRRQKGPWIGQAHAEYLDELLWGKPSLDRSAFASLARIVSTRQLLSTHRTVRSNAAVVSFTEAALADLPNMRAFRSHLARWDFEPYGISISREWLVARGARPVVYGDEQTWQQLPIAMRPFFQKRFGAGSAPIDWSCEREWRHLGIVDLANLPLDQAWVFVPTQHEAERISRISPWTVVVLSAP